MSEENVNIVRQRYDAVNRGDVDAALGVMEPNIEWQEPNIEGPPFGGTYHGPEDVANNVFGPALGPWDDFRVVPEEFLDAGERVVGLGRVQGRGKTTGRALDAPFAHLWTLRDGKAVHFRDYTDTAIFLESPR